MDLEEVPNTLLNNTAFSNNTAGTGAGSGCAAQIWKSCAQCTFLHAQ